MPVLPIEI